MSRRRSAERRPRWHYWLLLVVVCALSSLLMVQPGEIPDLQLSSGTLASRDVRAPSSFEFTDEETTEWRRREAEDSVALVFDHDLLSGERTLSRFESTSRPLKSCSPVLLGSPHPKHKPRPRPRGESRAENSAPRGSQADGGRGNRPGGERLVPALQQAVKLLSTSNRWKIVGARDPAPWCHLILEIGGGRAEYQHSGRDHHRMTPVAEALEALVMEEGETRRAVTLAMALLKPSLTPNALLTESAEPPPETRSPRPFVFGTTIIRQGDLIPRSRWPCSRCPRGQGDRSPSSCGPRSSPSASSSGPSPACQHHIRKFSTSVKDLTATGFLLFSLGWAPRRHLPTMTWRSVR